MFERFTLVPADKNKATPHVHFYFISLTKTCIDLFIKLYYMWIVFALLAAFTAGISVVLSKNGLKKVDPVLAFAIQSILIIIISWSTVWFQKRSDGLYQIDKRTWLFLIGAGLATCLSSLFQFSALKSGNASVVAPLVHLSLVFSIFFAILFLKEPINWKIIVGAVLMVGGAILISVSQKPA